MAEASGRNNTQLIAIARLHYRGVSRCVDKDFVRLGSANKRRAARGAEDADAVGRAEIRQDSL